MIPPEGDRRKDLAQRAVIDRIKTDIRNDLTLRLHRLVKLTVVLLSVLIVIQLGIGIWSLVLTKRQGDQNDRIADQANAIQASRIASVRSSCEEQNESHDETITQLTKLLTLNMLDQSIHDPRATKTSIRKASALSLYVKGLDTSTQEPKILVAFDDAKHLAEPPIAQAVNGQRTFTILLIDRLAPKQDCDARVRQISTATPTPTP